jgi:hypothetical protein
VTTLGRICSESTQQCIHRSCLDILAIGVCGISSSKNNKKGRDASLGLLE